MSDESVLDPQLLEALTEAIGPFAGVYDAIWRRERMYGYLAWLRTGEPAEGRVRSAWRGRPRNPIYEPWAEVTDAVLREEAEWWRSMRARDLTPEELVALVSGSLADTFGIDTAEATARVSDLSLARGHLPIWNSAFGCLLPCRLGGWSGGWEIADAQDNEAGAPGLGITYDYRHADAPARVSLYLYRGGTMQVAPGVMDPQCQSAFEQTMADMAAHTRNAGHTIQPLAETVVESVTSRTGAETQFLSATWRQGSPDGGSLTGAVSMTGFRGGLLKIRMTASDAFVESSEGQDLIEAMNTDFADFIARDGP